MRCDEKGKSGYLSESNRRRGQVRRCGVGRGQPEGFERGYKWFACALHLLHMHKGGIILLTFWRLLTDPSLPRPCTLSRYLYHSSILYIHASLRTGQYTSKLRNALTMMGSSLIRVTLCIAFSFAWLCFCSALRSACSPLTTRTPLATPRY